MKYVELIQQKAEQIFGKNAKANHWLNQSITFGRTHTTGLVRNELGYKLVKAELVY